MPSSPRLRHSPSEPIERLERQAMESTNDTASRRDKAGRPNLLSFDEMPEWFQHESNPFIHHSYRPISGSVGTSIRSWSYIHNESVNIYSHLVPALVFLLGEIYIQQHLASRYSGFTATDAVVITIFMLSGFTCLWLSTTYHTLLNHSAHMERICLRLDMLGVVIFLLGDLVLGTHLVFWCRPVPRDIYWSFVGVFGTMTIVVTLHPNFQGRKYRNFRALMFVAVGLSGFAPLIHGLIVFGWRLMMKKALPYTMGKAVCLWSGTAFYATRFPESRYPGKFDLWGSHAIFHLLVVCTSVIQSTGYWFAYDYAQGHITC